MTIQSWKWRKFQFIIFSGNYSSRSSQNALQWVNCRDWTRIRYGGTLDTVKLVVRAIPSSDGNSRTASGDSRTKVKDHPTWPSRIKSNLCDSGVSLSFTNCGNKMKLRHRLMNWCEFWYISCISTQKRRKLGKLTEITELLGHLLDNIKTNPEGNSQKVPESSLHMHWHACLFCVYFWMQLSSTIVVDDVILLPSINVSQKSKLITLRNGLAWFFLFNLHLGHLKKIPSFSSVLDSSLTFSKS
jgi:hypothetical protein